MDFIFETNIPLAQSQNWVQPICQVLIAPNMQHQYVLCIFETNIPLTQSQNWVQPICQVMNAPNMQHQYVLCIE